MILPKIEISYSSSTQARILIQSATRISHQSPLDFSRDDVQNGCDVNVVKWFCLRWVTESCSSLLHCL